MSTPVNNSNNSAVDTANVTANMISDTKVATGAVRLSYPHLLEPWASSGEQKPKYTTQIHVDKEDKETQDCLDKAIEAAMAKGRQKFGSAFQGKKVALPVHDGDIEKEGNPDYEGKLYLNCSNTRRPQVVDADFNPITDDEEVYGGCIARVSIEFYPYSVSGHMGISASLGNVQKLADGEPLGSGKSSALSDFGGGTDSFFA